MKTTIAITSALMVVLSACGTGSVDDGFGEVDPPETVATADEAGTDSEGQKPEDESERTDDTAVSDTTTTVQVAPETTTRDVSSSGAASAEKTSTTSVASEGDSSGKEAAVIGQVPSALMEQVLAHAEGHTGRAASAMTVVRAEAVTWPDGSLGCPEPGMQYTQALVPGYWVEISVGGEVLDYRLSENGGMKLCEGEGLIPSPRDDT